MRGFKDYSKLNLLQRIELLDWGFEMSDDRDVYRYNRQLRDKIEEELSSLAVDEVQNLISNLSPYGFSNWGRYFKLIYLS